MTNAVSEYPIRRYQVSGGIQLVAEVGGNPSAPTVLLLHGGGQTRHSWGGVMKELIAHGYHVVNLDARGHGDSDWSPDGRYDLEVLAEDLICVIDTLSSKPALVGASMGGAAALYLVGNQEHPTATALVLVDFVPLINAPGASRIRAFMSAYKDGFANLDEAADAIHEYNPHRARPKDSEGLLKNLRRRPNGRLYWHWDPRVIAEGADAEPPLWVEQLTAAADRVTIPALLVRGLESDVVTDHGVADLKNRIPQLELFDVAGAGHMVAGDKNDAFSSGVFDFLRRKLPVP
jgi:pimeloyl-ACP methyl ester carboxylesterase